MGRLRNVKAKLDAINALTPASRGAYQLHDPSYDGAEDEPKDDPPESIRPYDPHQPWTPGQPQNGSMMPTYQYNAFSATQNYQFPAQNYGQALQQGSPPSQGYVDNPPQQYQAQQGAPPQTPTPVDSYSGYQNHSYPQSSPTNPGHYPNSPPQRSEGSPPQPPFSPPPPQRSATDYYHPPTPQLLHHRSQTMPSHSQAPHYPPAWIPQPHDCTLNQDPILGRCLICQPINTH
ncbi:hypothetical protein FB567DRAFT_61457 [Paraphoma chrysanthemicola]|uniref:Uncharacterized protein n=1 Tax=Paraphoma chrysanthemicola TaxID=798071 RepID=A0A8K0VYU3_9PLEO|nr:hypothetical protein FB567DRAFT_61457 [Paraphoma chrysanthemicola]